MLEKGVALTRRAAAAVLGCTGLYVCAQFVLVNVLGMDWPIWYSEPLDLLRRYVLESWGFGLAMLCLLQRSQTNAKVRADFTALGLLLLWIIIPFAVRFGVTFNNVGSWYNAFVAFVGIYMTTAAGDEQRRACSLNAVCWGMLTVSLIWGGLLLFCAATAQSIDLGAGGYGFGVELAERGCLCSGMHYNITGMLAVCCCLVDLCGFSRSSRKAVKALYLLGAGITAIVVVLTQSRTARYALLLAAASGVFGWLQSRLSEKKCFVRFGVSAALAAAVLAGGFVSADALVKTAVRSYEQKGIVSVALAEEEAHEEPLQETPAAGTGETLVVRSAGDFSFSARTQIWRNALRYWAQNPKLLLIGSGVGRIGSQVVEGTIHETLGAVQLHNTYLQFIADYGLIGFLLLCAFLLQLVCPTLRALLLPKGETAAGSRALAMLVIACLLTGFMESAPLAPLGTMNALLFFALGQISPVS